MLRAPTVEDEPSIIALNQRNVVETAPLTPALWRALAATAFRVRVACTDGTLQGFLLALDETSACDGPNFGWFRARFARFVYIDRVIVSEAWRGRGVARALYRDLIEAARASGRRLLCCEVNVDPPNPASDGFHAAMGFSEVGRARLRDRGKTVRYLTLPLVSPPS